MKTFKQYLFEAVDDYKGQHQAPGLSDGAPLYDVTLNGIYPEDIYSPNGKRYYGSGEIYDNESFSIVNACHNKPNSKVKIYRAVPNNIDKDLLKELLSIHNYYIKWKFFPVGNKIIEFLDTKYPIDQYGYEKMQELILKDIRDQIDEIQKNKIKLKINKGDWVTISKKYAIDHGKSALNNKFDVITKTVKAKEIVTNGDSIHEWGYV